MYVCTYVHIYRYEYRYDRRRNVLTIPGAVKSVESIKVGILKALVISVESPHHTRPRLTKDEISLSFALDRATVLVEKLRQDPKERERLRRSIRNIGYLSFPLPCPCVFYSIPYLRACLKFPERRRRGKRALTAEPGFIGVAPGSGVITWPPVSVCQNVSAMLHLPWPTRL